MAAFALVAPLALVTDVVYWDLHLPEAEAVPASNGGRCGSTSSTGSLADKGDSAYSGTLTVTQRKAHGGRRLMDCIRAGMKQLNWHGRHAIKSLAGSLRQVRIRLQEAHSV